MNLPRYGMDHELYAYSMLQDRAPFVWPGGKRIAVVLCVTAQFYPLNQQGKPFKVPGGMTTPYPDLRHFSLREYGNRVGIFRVLDAIAASGLRPCFAVNSDLTQRAPALVRELAELGEVIAHGANMDALHYGGMDIDAEALQISTPANVLRKFTGQAVRGWLSPAKSQSANTPTLLRQHGFDYCLDWINDELPYAQQTPHGVLHNVPLSSELEDRFVLMNNQHSDASWCEQVCDAFDFLRAESGSHVPESDVCKPTPRSAGARLLALQIHPWLLGQPQRIGFLEQALQHIAACPDVYSATPAQIVDHYQCHTTPTHL